MCEGFPVVRYGRLALADLEGNPVSATYGQGEAIIDSVNANPQPFDQAVINAIDAYFVDHPELGNFEWLTDQDGENFTPPITLRGPKRNADLGSIYDFSDIMLQHGPYTVLFRGCTTVCTNGWDEDLLDVDQNERTYSKLWVRAYCARFEDSPAYEVPQEHLDTFFAIFLPVCKAACEALRTPYQAEFRQHVNEEADIKLTEEIITSAVSTDDESYEVLYSRLEGGDALTSIAGMPLAETLINLSSHTENVITQDAEELDKSVMIRTRDDDYTGIYVRAMNDNLANFFGVTRADMEFSSADLRKQFETKERKFQPSYRCTAEIAIKAGQRF